jgi:predicted DNA-binding transcriptional regulator AlpA
MGAVTLAQIARLTGVRRPSVSNWRRRHADFPQPIEGTASQPTFDTDEIAHWLDRRPVPPEQAGTAQVRSYGEVFRAALRVTGRAGRTSDEFLDTALRRLAELVAGGSSVDEDGGDGEVDRLFRALGPAAAAEELFASVQRAHWSGAAAETPEQVCELVRELAAELLGDLAELRVLDLAAGPGRLVSTVCAGAEPKSVLAVEPDARAREWLTLRLRCHGHTDVTVSPALAPGEPPADLVLVDPPFQPGERDQAEEHPLVWARRAAGLLTPEGAGFAVVPEWTLTRYASARRLPVVRDREALVRDGCLRAIVQLPRYLHRASTGTDFVLLVLGSPEVARPESVLVVDASALRESHPGDWGERTTHLVTDASSGHSGQPCRAVPVAELLASHSYLPAHLIVEALPVEEHAEVVVRARQAAIAVHSGAANPAPVLDAIGVAARPTAARHRTVGELIRGGQLLRLPGHRIPEADLGGRGQRVIGREELLGESPLGARRIDVTTLGRYPAATITEPGDVLVLAGRQLRAIVDDAGGSVLLTPAVGLRIPGYHKHSGLFRDEPQRAWIGPYALAALLSADRNTARSAPRVRAVSLHQLDVPALTPAEYDQLEQAALHLADLAEQARRQAAALDAFLATLATGVADGALAIGHTPPTHELHHTRR